MKKLLALTLLASASLFAAPSGEEIFDTKCTACHLKEMPSAMKNNPEGSPEFMTEVSKLKAPPLPRLVEYLKAQMESKEEFVAFVADYIANPSKEKAKCRKPAVENFGVMPPIGKAMSEDERKSVAEWIYSTQSASKSNCNTMKCAAGKCGGKEEKSAMKCAAGKCGGQ
jgi:cytochrome c5